MSDTTNAPAGRSNYSMGYDLNGNITNDGTGRSFTYFSYDKVKRIEKGTSYSEFEYGSNRARYYKRDRRTENGQTANYYTTYIGDYEKIHRTGGGKSTLTEHKVTIGNVVITDRSDGTDAENYLHKDHLGSTISVTDKVGNVVQQFTYDPWGKQTKIYQTASFLDLTFNQPTNRGFTGHEMIDGLDIIHMNGRIYDADLGRFMQADPNIQSPGNFQNYNRYSYVLNNPLRYTDPSGFFFKDLVKGDGFLFGFSNGGGVEGGILQGYINHNVHKFVANSQTLVQTGAIVIGAYTAAWCGPCSIGFTALYTSNIASYQGASTSEAFHAGGKAAAIAGVFYAIGSAFDADSGFWETNGAGHIATHAVVGGVIADLQGGKFAHGFWAAGVTKGAGSGINGMCGNCGAAGIALRVVVAATLGGTVSKLSGGKFSNGARTAAFAQLFNNELNRKPKTLNLTSEEMDQIKSTIHDLIVDMQDKIETAFWDKDMELMQELFGVKYVNSTTIDIMVDGIVRARLINGIGLIHSSVEVVGERGLRFVIVAFTPAKLNSVGAFFNAVAEIFSPSFSTVSNIQFYGKNNKWHSSFTKDGNTYTQSY